MMEIVFDQKEIYVESKKKSNLKHPETGFYLELDVYIPKHKICFEFQVIYFLHYTIILFSNHTY